MIPAKTVALNALRPLIENLRLPVVLILIGIVPIEALPAQHLSDPATLSRLGEFAKRQQKTVAASLKAAEARSRVTAKRTDESQGVVAQIAHRRMATLTSHSIVLKQLVSLGKGEPSWKAGPFVPLTFGSVQDLAVHLKIAQFEAKRGHAEAAGRLAFAEVHSESSADRELHRERLREHEKLQEAFDDFGRTLGRILAAIGRPSVDSLYALHLVRIARERGRMEAIAAERERRADIGASFWIALGALRIAGLAIEDAVIAEELRKFRQGCKEAGGDFYDGPHPTKKRVRLVECR